VSRYFSYLNSASHFVQSYKHDEPFASFLKKQFAADKKFGSRDRKQIAHLCYCYFRLGGLMKGMDVEKRIMAGLFLCSSAGNDVLQALQSEWNEKAAISVDEKLELLQLSIDKLFPLDELLSNGIEREFFFKSHFQQPDLFLRIRPGMNKMVLEKLNKAGLRYELKSDDCIALPNNTKTDDVLLLNKEVVVQDWSSQRVGSFLDSARKELQTLRLRSGSSHQSETPFRVWDCCAASGGKSIMAKDILGNVELTVSDVRESILNNLKKRFAEAGISNYKSFVADLTTTNYQLPATGFKLIIADVPCSGSGTWGRTPEYLSTFDETQLQQYSELQKKIVTNIISHLSGNGYLLYITCSVYQNENEEVVQYLLKENNLELIEMKLLKGNEQKADSMFAALLRKADS
jgi:16S rRNA (cytosine967-C5)-methyltransferase